MDVHKIDWSAIEWTPVRQGVERNYWAREDGRWIQKA